MPFVLLTAIGKKELALHRRGWRRRTQRYRLHGHWKAGRRRGIDPYAYLRDVLTRLPHMTNHQIPEVLPVAWAKTLPATPTTRIW